MEFSWRVARYRDLILLWRRCNDIYFRFRRESVCKLVRRLRRRVHNCAGDDEIPRGVARSLGATCRVIVSDGG